MQTKGLIRHIGLSEVSVEEIENASKYVKVESIQNMYNLGQRKWEQTLQWCEKNHIPFLPWYPLFAGKDHSSEVLKNLESKYNASSYQIALSWLLNHSPVMLPIAGTSKASHLEENMKALEIQISDDDLKELNSVV